MQVHYMAAPRYRSIQALRGFAAVIVVIFHALHLWSDNVTSHPHTWDNGASGVDLFFIISGFVMALTNENSSREFIRRRFIRIAPLYWVMTTVMLMKAATVYLHPGLAHGAPHAELTLTYISASYLFIPFRDSAGQVLPLLAVGWTLSFEMLFYACFAIAIALRVNAVRLLTPVFAAFAIVGLFVTSPAIMSLASPMMLEFVAGLWLGNLAKSGREINKNVAISAGIIGIVGILSIPLPSANMRPFTWGVMGFLIVFSAIGLERYLGLPEWTQRLGDTSYSLYLVHVPLFSVCYRILRGAFNSPHGQALTVATCLLISLSGSALLRRFVEIPFTSAIKGIPNHRVLLAS